MRKTESPNPAHCLPHLRRGPHMGVLQVPIVRRRQCFQCVLRINDFSSLGCRPLVCPSCCVTWWLCGDSPKDGNSKNQTSTATSTGTDKCKQRAHRNLLNALYDSKAQSDVEGADASPQYSWSLPPVVTQAESSVNAVHCNERGQRHEGDEERD